MDGGLADHVPHVYRLALRLTQNVHRAEDLTQETFLRAWQRCNQLKDQKAIRSWLFRIAVNLMNDEYRKQEASHRQSQDTIDELTSPRPAPDAAAETSEELALTLKLLNDLPTRQRVVLHLVTVEDFSLAEVCEVLEISMNTAKVNLSLARKRMREEWDKRTAQFGSTSRPVESVEKVTSDE
jgi:RNA polymerase sigma-70 factor (ECF subfamily)